MIISRLSGGLGNQMFQYAAAKALALKFETELLIDATNFKVKKEKLTPREFELSIFEKESFQLLSEERKKKLLLENLPFLSKVKNKIFGRKSLKYFTEKGFQYNQEFSSISNDSYIIGYFQSEKYFKKFESAIRTSFTFPEKMSEENNSFCSEISTCNSISVHIRRGDYVKVSSNLKHHGICSLAYYQIAMREISQKVDQPVFYFFSDDIKWVKENIKCDWPTRYVEHNTGEQSFEDMRLMSHCKHHVIANSSFSWWGAWLNPNKDKIVIVPKPWFNEPEREKETIDLIPANWIRLQK